MVPLAVPSRVTVKVNDALPELPSALTASAAAMASPVSSFWIVPITVAVAICAPPEALESVTENPSSGSAAVSPLTLTVMVLAVSPAAKLTVPPGSVPPKSAALAGLGSLPVTA